MPQIENKGKITRKREKISYAEWLAKFGQESCADCVYNQPTKARCLYKGPRCVRYENYIKE